MLRALLRDSLLYTASNVLTRGLGFLLLPLYTRVFSPEEFGTLDYLMAVGSFVSVTVALEIAQGLARFIPEHVDDPGARRAYASTSLWFTISSHTLMVVLVVIFRRELAEILLESGHKADLIVVASIAFWVNGLVYLIQSQLRWELRAKDSGLLSIVVAALMIVFSLITVVALRWGVVGVLMAQIASGVIALILGFYLTRSSYGLLFDWRHLRRMLVFSVPLIPSSVGVIVALYVDRLAIKELLSLSDVGLFGVGYKVAMVASLALAGFRGALTPLVYAHYRKAATPLDLARIFRIFCAFALVLFACLALFASRIIGVVAPDSYSAAASVVPILVLAVLFSNMYIFAPGLDIEKRTGMIALINLSAALLNTTLNFAFIPAWGIEGAALATAVSFFCAFCVYMRFSQKLYPVPHQWGSLLCAFVMVVIVIVLAGNADLVSWLDWVVRGAVLVVLSYGIVRLRLLEPAEIRSALNVLRIGGSTGTNNAG
ncbi:MAG: hypothetical protein CALGDGBN_02646 [Pseudomonadales bacterium]|nr:hypothetical protein [Pseudomonadales bacterium]